MDEGETQQKAPKTAVKAVARRKKKAKKRRKTPLNEHQEFVMRQVVLAAAPLTVAEVSQKIGVSEISARRLICRMRRRASAKGHKVAGPGSVVMPMSRTVLPASEDRHRVAVRLDAELFDLVSQAAERTSVSITVLINDALEVCRGRLTKLAKG